MKGARGVVVLIPATVRDCEWRQRALAAVLGHYTANHGWRIHLADHGEGPWCKAAAIARARENVNAEVLVIADADVIADPHELEVAVADCALRTAHWAVPYAQVRRLDDHTTQEYYDRGGLPNAPVLDRPTYRRGHRDGTEGGGLVVIRSDVYDAVPMDPRFVGWGSEDVCWGLALLKLVGTPRRGDGTLWHLWHPPAAPGQSRSQNADGRMLHRRYFKASSGRPAEMRALLDELRTT